MRTVLTIAGSDPSGGAGLQADLKTFAAFGVFGTTAVTAITVQNTVEVTTVYPLPAALVRDQIDIILRDIGANAVKIGMLGTGAVAAAVADALGHYRLPHVVLDTVMHATAGPALLDASGIDVMISRLIPLVEVVTANIPEAMALTGRAIVTLDDSREAARVLVQQGARAAIVKGGHLSGPPIDILYDGLVFTELRAERLATRGTHGTGCTFASAVAARLALGDALADAAHAAKAYVTRAIAQGPNLGRGRGPLQHFPSS